MQRIILPTGLTIIVDQQPSQSVTVFAQVNVGSNNEPQQLSGISHFLEHMIFEGTKKRPNGLIIAREIDKWGGDFNAYTQNDRTCFYIKVLKDYFDVALDIIADILQNSTFNPKFIEKERKVIIKEINMVNDDPRNYQWVLAGQLTYPNHVAGIPIHGSKQKINKMTRNDIVKFYKEFYVPSNTYLVISGDVKQAMKKTKQKFASFKGKQMREFVLPPIAPLEKVATKIQKKKVMSTYLVWSWQGVDRLNADSYALDIVQAILSKGQSGTLFDALRNRYGLAYELGATHDTYKDYGYFAINTAVAKLKVKLAEKVVFEEIGKVQDTTASEVEDAKNYIIGRYLVDNEDTYERADQIAFFEQCHHASLIDSYVDKIRKVSREQVVGAAKKLFSQRHSLVMLTN